jgi:hypothetical protein
VFRLPQPRSSVIAPPMPIFRLFPIYVLCLTACAADPAGSASDRGSSPQSGLNSQEPSSVMVVAYILYDGEQQLDANGNPLGFVSSGTIIGPHHVLTVEHGLMPPQEEVEATLGKTVDPALLELRPVVYASDVATSEAEVAVEQAIFNDTAPTTETQDESDVAILITSREFTAEKFASLDFSALSLPTLDTPWPCGYEMVGYGAPLSEQVKRTVGAVCLAPLDFVESENHRSIVNQHVLDTYGVDVSNTEVPRPAKNVLPTVAPYSPFIESWSQPFYGPLFPATNCKGASGGGIYRVGTPSQERALMGMHHGVWWPIWGDMNGIIMSIGDGCSPVDSEYTIGWYSSIATYADFIRSTLASY